MMAGSTTFSRQGRRWLAGFACLSALVASIGASASQPTDTLACAIRHEAREGLVALTASVASQSEASGNARLLIRKSGGAGASNLSQSHQFSVEAHRDVAVGEATIGLEPGAHLTAELTASTKSGAQCRASLSLEP